MNKVMYIGEGFVGNGVNAAHINIILGPRNGPVGQAFVNSLAMPRQGHCPFMVIIKEGVPVKPATLYANKAEITGELHGNATWGASQAGIAKAITEALLSGVLPKEAEDEWCVVVAPWVNPSCDNLDEIFDNNYKACQTAIAAAMAFLPIKQDVALALNELGNPFYQPKS
ncbi:formaldehyde-activating enzyme [Thorsellia anophelis]|uniref:5,6,7,8-tetrahydromethanopterin hydro-lyase n=1 Tax=Thorsellia anophelis DSM 18579 TaxID=1123402 RepID=A0A1I0CV51_9GAMM|nr:formaldehyde-activating enzyme [Thorsellia anophelis]SET23287.1 5,6,7,8-tetrahydromethanopterin hydro-lyase [Thorsellia anophelis DSM 18579]